MKRLCFHLARKLHEHIRLLHGSWRIVQNHKSHEADRRVLAQRVLKLIIHEGYAPFMFDSFDLIDIPSSEEEHVPLLMTHVPVITP